jgi:dTDP-6-deoxy-L-talose 4-dehydrogenase (NAD+)
VLVTGATGFVGQHVVRALLNRNHNVVIVTRQIESAKKFEWYDNVEIIECDLYEDYNLVFKKPMQVDALIHLAWSGLPNYQSYFHIDINLVADLSFLRSAINFGIKHLVVAGTCLEYGLKSGELSEDMDTHPTTPYGFAKDALRRSLEFLQKEEDFSLQWMRLFYMYGEGQSSKSLVSQLNEAISQKAPIFNMSSGEQLRDYLPIEEVARFFSYAIERPDINGVINCCSGKPISVLSLVKKICEEQGFNMQLNKGFYKIPLYEAFNFWGSSDKLKKLVNDDIKSKN